MPLIPCPASAPVRCTAPLWRSAHKQPTSPLSNHAPPFIGCKYGYTYLFQPWTYHGYTTDIHTYSKILTPLVPPSSLQLPKSKWSMRHESEM
eukprot:358772-Chlamydomonas_euryale.AAC.14